MPLSIPSVGLTSSLKVRVFGTNGRPFRDELGEESVVDKVVSYCKTQALKAGHWGTWIIIKQLWKYFPKSDSKHIRRPQTALPIFPSWLLKKDLIKLDGWVMHDVFTESNTAFHCFVVTSHKGRCRGADWPQEGGNAEVGTAYTRVWP